jgi:tetratricopeptide (TPR) repeat protein
MKKNLLTIAIVLILGSISYAQQLTDEEAGFSVWFPGEPTIENKKVNGMPSRKYTVATNNAGFNVSFSDLSVELKSASDVSKLFDGLRDELLTKFNGKLIADNNISLSENPGRSISFTTKNSMGTLLSSVRIFLVRKRLYQVIAAALTKNPQTVNVNRFFNSFKFTALESEPTESAEKLLDQGIAEFAAGNDILAIKKFTTAIKLKPNYALAYYSRGSVYSFSKQNVLAIADYTKAISLDPELYEAYFERGKTYYDTGKTSLAIKDLSKAIELNPDFADAYSQRADCYEKLGRKDLAELDRKKAKMLGK